MNSDDVTVCEELGHGAFGKVCKGILKTTSCMAHGLSVQKIGKKEAKSTIIVAVKMLQGMLQQTSVYDLQPYLKYLLHMQGPKGYAESFNHKLCINKARLRGPCH